MKIILICLALLIGACAQADDDDMPEFCGAILIVVQDLPEFEAWKTRYALDTAIVLRYQIMLQEQLKSGYIKHIQVTNAAQGCRLVRQEELIEHGNE